MGESRCWNKVVEVGLTVDEEYSYIAASRDFDAGEFGAVEVKSYKTDLGDRT